MCAAPGRTRAAPGRRALARPARARQRYRDRPSTTGWRRFAGTGPKGLSTARDHDLHPPRHPVITVNCDRGHWHPESAERVTSGGAAQASAGVPRHGERHVPASDDGRGRYQVSD
ncbi:hypothetical protein GCM10009660_08220 [Catellatospora bangladeshensis]